MAGVHRGKLKEESTKIGDKKKEKKPADKQKAEKLTGG